MDLHRLKFVITIALLAIIVDITATKCVEQTHCSCHLLDGSFYDLGKIAVTGPINGSGLNYTYSFQPCTDVKMQWYNTTKSTECSDGIGVSLCAFGKTTDNQTEKEPINLGTVAETKWSVPDNLLLTLTHGLYTSEILVVCCQDCPQTLNLITKTDKKFTYTLTTPHGCKLQSPPEGLSTGSVLVILLFVFSGVYLLVGALTLRFLRGAIGWELIPNYDFWCELPVLVRDGIAFTFSGCSVETYDRI